MIAESDEDVLLYETGHIPGAVKIDWHADLNDQLTRDYVDAEGFARLMSSKGVTRETTIVFYGDNFNWWAAYALWVCSLFAHPDVRLLDGGRHAGSPRAALTTDVPTPAPAEYPIVARDDTTIRAFKETCSPTSARPLVDVRSPGEYSGELPHMADYPQEGALRGGHIPGARNVPWARAATEDATFSAAQELEAIYQGEPGCRPDDDVVAYCRIGERSSHTWFVLHAPARLPNVRNYDGSWTEWGNSVRVPITPRGQPVTTPSALLPGSRRSSKTSPHGGQGPPGAAAGIFPGAARPAGALRRAPGPDGAGPGMPDAVFPGRRDGGGRCRAPVLRRPAEAPTTRGFASILDAGLDGLGADEVLETPAEFSSRLGLADLVSPLRLRGMAAMLARIKRQVREQREAR